MLRPGSMSKKAEVLSTHTPELFRLAVAAAARLLQAGEVVGLPTETVYGLAANALDAKAVAKIYDIKGRPANNPVIVHVASLSMAQECVSHWPEAAEKLARSFWPGPLTLVLPRSRAIPDVVSAGGPTVGVRGPVIPLFQEVIRACGFPLAAPSANLSNEISPTNASHVAQKLGGKLALIVDGGQSQVGIESTVVEVNGASARVLRPGIIHEEIPGGGALGKATWLRASSPSSQTPRFGVPGCCESTILLEPSSWFRAGRANRTCSAKCADFPLPLKMTHVIAHSQIPSGASFSRVSGDTP